MKPRRPDAVSSGRAGVSLRAVVVLALLAVAPLGLLGRGGEDKPRSGSVTPLARIAEGAGCRLTEFEDGTDSNPPVTGRFVERIRARDGSYAGRRPPSLLATTHALLHGRVLFQYRRGLSDRE